jgi:quercetin dioxygenase-like cupin family protein
MQTQGISRTEMYALTFFLLGFLSCSPPAPPSAGGPLAAAPAPLILAVNEGEARTWRNWGDTPFIIKVDRQNGGSPELFMGYEDIAPGLAIPFHRHPTADEIVFVHRGSGVAQVGQREAAFTEGATVYIPRNVRVSIRNTGTTPLSIVFIFSKPGFEEFMRDNSVPTGQPVLPLSEAELARIREKHRSHVIYGQP